MNNFEKQQLSKIHYLISEAHSLYNELSNATKDKIQNIHNEEFSLAYTLRWGEIAASEIRDEFDR